jgi:hypothetical protein
MLLAGLTSFADWIGSNEAWFPFGSPMDCENLPSWFESRRSGADRALDAIGWAPRAPLTLAPRSFKEVRINAVIDRYGALIARARRTALPQFSAAQLDLLRSVMRSWATTRAVGDVLIGGLAAALEDASLPGGRGDPDAVAGVLAHVRGLSASEQLALIEEIERGP